LRVANCKKKRLHGTVREFNIKKGSRGASGEWVSQSNGGGKRQGTGNRKKKSCHSLNYTNKLASVGAISRAKKKMSRVPKCSKPLTELENKRQGGTKCLARKYVYKD